MTGVLGLELCPLFVPWRRRMQTLAVLISSFIFFLSPAACFAVPLYILACCSPIWWTLVALYAVWFVYDWNGPRRGSHTWNALRNCSLYRDAVDYFPVKLIKTAELDAERKYIFAYHPHGIGGFGAFLNFATNGTGFNEKFPGIRTKMCTLMSNFIVPFRREYCELLGLVDVSRQSIEYVLNDPKPGLAVVIVPGGAAEALHARPGSFTLVLKKRQGFVRLALKTGADLVPVFAFGENDLYSQMSNPEGSTLRHIQQKFKEFIGFSPVVFHGRGVFNYSFGILPYRRPINTVVGKPIRVSKCDNPSPEDIDKLHSEYLDALSDLFDAHKTDFDVPATEKLLFI